MSDRRQRSRSDDRDRDRDRRRRQNKLEEQQRARARREKVRGFLAGEEAGKVFGSERYLGTDKKNRPVVAFDERHLKAMGREGRDKIRDALEIADKREGLEIFDRSAAMKLARLREAKEIGDRYEARAQGKRPDEQDPGVGFSIVDSFYKADNIVRVSVFVLSGIFVVLLFRFLFFPLFSI